MKILKGIGIFFLSLFAFIFVFLISLSLIFRNVIQKGVVGSVVKNIMIEEFSKVKKLTAEDKENIEKVNKVIKTDDINKLDKGSYKITYTITYKDKYSTTKTKTINIK